VRGWTVNLLAAYPITPQQEERARLDIGTDVADLETAPLVDRWAEGQPMRLHGSFDF
jgi:hypothetical protein